MKLKNALLTLPFFRHKTKSHQLYTEWGKNLDPNHILEEYPRPQLRRDNYTILNGYWNYCITKKHKEPSLYDGKILVPFSPESVLSEVNRQLIPGEFLWYQRDFHIKDNMENKRLILHFGAVDQFCEVMINHEKVTEHMGGYLPFSVDITDKIRVGKNIITLKVEDTSDTSYHSRGKQKLNRGGMFYTAQSGIWQTVWMEWVPKVFIESIVITPNVDKNYVQLEFNMSSDYNTLKDTGEFKVDIYYHDMLVKSTTSTVNKTLIPLEAPFYWSPEQPNLYDMTITYGEDKVYSYFAMRKYEIKKDENGYARIYLNGIPYFQNGILDQGYWSDGLYTAPSDEAMIFDITRAKDLGFNMIRKHIKIEPLRWYYHCDRLGMIVWQDMVNGGNKHNTFFVGYLPTLFPKLADHIKDKHYFLFGRENKMGRKEWISEVKDTVKHLYNTPSIAVWVPFNEGWGQFKANRVTSFIKRLDHTRLIDHASGWFDQQGGDFKSIHDYFFNLNIAKDDRVVVLSELGGYACLIPNHSFSDTIYGYRIYRDKNDLNNAYQLLFNRDIKELIQKGLSAVVYTQLSDVEDEVNGIFTYDRKVCKVSKINLPYIIDTKTEE